jgi:hypothetical protein
VRVANVCLVIVQLLFTSITLTAQGQAVSLHKGTLTVNVVDFVEGAPIRAAFVLVHRRVGGARDITLRLDSGRGKLSLPTGLYDVFVSASAFAPTCAAISIESGQTANLALRLRADEAHLEQTLAK